MDGFLIVSFAPFEKCSLEQKKLTSFQIIQSSTVLRKKGQRGRSKNGLNYRNDVTDVVGFKHAFIAPNDENNQSVKIINNFRAAVGQYILKTKIEILFCNDLFSIRHNTSVSNTSCNNRIMSHIL